MDQATDKEKSKLLRLQKVSANLENNARKELDEIDKIKKRAQKREKLAYE
jgi:hypothetical protein